MVVKIAFTDCDFLDASYMQPEKRTEVIGPIVELRETQCATEPAEVCDGGLFVRFDPRWCVDRGYLKVPEDRNKLQEGFGAYTRA